MPTSTLENKIDLLLSLHQDHNARLKRLETKIDPHSQSKEKTWISCSEMGKRVGLQGRTIQKYINRGLFPTELLRRKLQEQPINGESRLIKVLNLSIMVSLLRWKSEQQRAEQTQGRVGVDACI